MKKSQKYTITLPFDMYEGFSREAEAQDRSIKEVIRRYLQLGMVIMKIILDPNAELFIHERVEIPGSDPKEYEERQTKIQMFG